ncbi:XRE family transcriptional regulator [Rhodanobacter sp. Root627]|uniref:helix-turn-helix domain-containing protein n=1 Tax=Rhodanobacter sp. Root627 TaxID=1736572 RepID=UPI0009EB5621|nr:XRE family transcriptional regulator [Rhodanobacter sp. Root627]
MTISIFLANTSNMQTLQEVGEAVAVRRRSLGLKQGEVATRAGISQDVLSRFERGKSAEFGSRKLLAVLAALGMELQITETGASGSLDELRRERGGA